MERKRDANGRFMKGDSGGPGRPPKAREERYYEITMTACTYQDWEDIVKKAISQAKRGDSVARKWLSDFLVGVPEQNLGGILEVIVRYVDKTD